MPKRLGEKEATNLGGFELRKKDKIWTNRRKFERTYYVLADTIADNEIQILVTTGLPVLFSLLGGAFCVEKKGKEIARVRHPSTGAATALWEVTAKFDSDIDVDEGDQPPEARTPKVRWYGEQELKQIFKDVRTGEPITNKVGEVIVIEEPVVLPILEIKRYATFPFDPNVQLDYANHVNSEPFWGAPAGCALMMAIEVEEEIIEGTKYNHETYTIKFAMERDEGGQFIEDTWKARPLHQGTKHVTEEGVVEQWTDENRQPGMVNLDEGGMAIVPEGGVLNPNDLVFLEFWTKSETDFNNLNLGPFN